MYKMQPQVLVLNFRTKKVRLIHGWIRYMKLKELGTEKPARTVNGATSGLCAVCMQLQGWVWSMGPYPLLGSALNTRRLGPFDPPLSLHTALLNVSRIGVFTQADIFDAGVKF